MMMFVSRYENVLRFM
uniref:Uncharacterized protein n=1 Tax=Rhizophora mucronata TaxID=61149 RepID=A0A2P2N5Q3_RHIMU